MARDYNPKRAQPTSAGVDLEDIVHRLILRVDEMAQATIRGLPPGYRFEVDGSGPLIRNQATGQIARLEWETTA